MLSHLESEYNKNKDLKREDVLSLLTWSKKQQHLPEINELQAIIFLHSCYYSNEATKTVIDTFFTVKTQHPEIFKGRNPLTGVKKAINTSLATILPKKTASGDTVVFLKFMDANPDNFNFLEHLKYLDMVCMLDLHKNGTSQSHVIVADLKGTVFGHVTKVVMTGPLVIKTFMFYLQEAMPIRLKGIHFVNIVPFMDKILALIKPFLKTELWDLLHLHNTVDDLGKFVPLECLPGDYGGTVDDTHVLHENVKSLLVENSEFFDWEDKQKVDETKRENKGTRDGNIFGVDGTFKKLELD